MKRILLFAIVMFLSSIFVGSVSAWSEKDERHRQYIEQLDRKYEARQEYKRNEEQRRQEDYERTYGGRDRAMEEIQRGLERIEREEGRY